MNTDETLPLPEPADGPEPMAAPDATETLPLADGLALEGADPAASGLSSDADADSAASLLVPRTRWAAIIWGLVFAAIAWGGIWMLSSANRREDVTTWFASLNPGTITAYVLLMVGALALLTGLIGLIRRAQRHAAAS